MKGLRWPRQYALVIVLACAAVAALSTFLPDSSPPRFSKSQRDLVSSQPNPFTAVADDSPAPRWVTECVSQFEKRSLSVTKVYRETPIGPANCRHSLYVQAGFELRNRITGEFLDAKLLGDLRNSYKAPAQWIDRSSSAGSVEYYGAKHSMNFQRRSDGRTAVVTAYWPDSAPAAAPTLDRVERAVDECLAIAPAVVEVSDDPNWMKHCPNEMPSTSLDRCVRAHRFARAISFLCMYEGEAVGDAGRPGEAYSLLTQILALGKDASPVLIEMASSPSPVARVAAAVGLRQARSNEGKRVLTKLLNDHERVATQHGCIPDSREVASVAAESLREYQ